jgi:hypothetical protein
MLLQAAHPAYDTAVHLSFPLCNCVNVPPTMGPYEAQVELYHKLNCTFP